MEEIALRREAIRLKKLEISANPESVATASPPSPPVEEPVVDEEKHEFLAFARVFSGTLKRGHTLFILSPKHNPEDFIGKQIDLNTPIEQLQEISKHCSKFVISDLYLMMGRELEPINEVPSGNIVAIGGLENIVLKSATLSTSLFCPSFTNMYLQTSPIVRVAIEPKNPSKMKELVKGLKLLNQSDPCVEIMVQENGEHILCTAGEVHLQRCVDDLVQRFAQIEVTMSPPIIPFKETIVAPPKFDHVKEKIDQKAKETTSNGAVSDEALVEVQSGDRKLDMAARARPLPLQVTKFLEDNISSIKLLTRLNQNKICQDEATLTMLTEFKSNLRLQLEEVDAEEASETFKWSGLNEKIISFGPNLYGPNILVSCLPETAMSSVWSVLDNLVAKNSTSPTKNKSLKEFENSIIFGFNLVTSKGPLCEEPMQGVAFFIEKFQVNENLEEENVDSSFESEKRVKPQGVASSQFISLVKDCFRKAFEAQPQRLMAAMYKCEIMTVSSEALGKLYAVLGKRNAKIMDESLKEGTSMFIVTALMPVADSFGLAEEIRKRTSGLASPHIEFSHFEAIDIDPYWEPSTEEELLLYGDKADFENQAKKYMNEVRKRKGLFVKEKLVENAEKQRTLCYK